MSNPNWISNKIKFLSSNIKILAHHIRVNTEWRFLMRENQKPPDWNWFIWLILAGRGFGKTRTGSETLKIWINNEEYKNIALIANSVDDAREIMVEGRSGLLKVFENDNNSILFEPSKRKITWLNGAIAHLYSSENYEKLRGPEFDLVWIDELAKFEYPEETFNQAMLALRIGKNPRVIITTTPKPIPIIKKLMERKDIAITKGTTYENIKNLSKEFITNIREQFENTELGAQEIYAEVLEAQQIFLWSKDLIDQAKGNVNMPKHFLKKIIAIDPATTANKNSDETGIILAAIDDNGIIYILEDLTTKTSANDWCDNVIAAFYKYEADEIIVETNAGGELTEQLIKVKDPNIPIKGVFAKQGKITRAEPVIPLYKKGIIKHTKTFEKLEKQMLSFSSNSKSVLIKNKSSQKSPDRIDALVWAIADLKYYYEHMPKITLL